MALPVKLTFTPNNLVMNFYCLTIFNHLCDLDSQSLTRYFFLEPDLAPHPVFVKALCYLVAKSCPTVGTPWTVAFQVPLSMGFLRQECWRGLPFPSPSELSSLKKSKAKQNKTKNPQNPTTTHKETACYPV